MRPYNDPGAELPGRVSSTVILPFAGCGANWATPAPSLTAGSVGKESWAGAGRCWLVARLVHDGADYTEEK
jgi:hypothetical protein